MRFTVLSEGNGSTPRSSNSQRIAWAPQIDSFVGFNNEQYGTMYFQRTLEDWAAFDINNRTKHDASISSGLALMACNKHKYRPTAETVKEKVKLNFSKYSNKGNKSKIIIDD